jgi:hypothetical protein
MKKVFFLFLLPFLILGIYHNTLAESADCSDYYRLQSVQISAGPSKGVFAPGENVNFSGEIINENSYPVFDGYVFVRISEENPNYIKEGNNIKDEFIVAGPLAIDATSSKPINFSWTIPTNLKKGNYRADYFFSVDKKYSLGGLPFTNNFIVGLSTFSVNSTTTNGVSFDRSGTKVNGYKYNHIGNWQTTDPGTTTPKQIITKDSEVVITQPLVNSTKTISTTKISYELYFWDSLNQKDLLTSSTEEVTLKAGETKILKYIVPKANQTVYYLKLLQLIQIALNQL